MNEQELSSMRKGRGASMTSKVKKPKGRRKGEHPLAARTGSFKDDPLWDEFQEAMNRARNEEDAKADVSG
jgi:hypothetical protein